jgi:hypothetical protein
VHLVFFEGCDDLLDVFEEVWLVYPSLRR